LQFLAKYYEGDKIKKSEQRRMGGTVGGGKKWVPDFDGKP